MKIAIDGPAGAGKSTIGRAIARAFSCLFVSTGAMYRAAALGLERGLTLEQIKINITPDEKILLNQQDVTYELYTAEVDELASRAATRAEIRERLVKLQQEIAQHRNVVMEGRDIATVVLPDADVKIFLTASAEERARRRSHERDSRDVYEAILKRIRERDERDSAGFQRMQITPETMVISTEGRSLEDVIAEVLSRVSVALQERKKLGKL